MSVLGGVGSIGLREGGGATQDQVGGSQWLYFPSEEAGGVQEGGQHLTALRSAGGSHSSEWLLSGKISWIPLWMQQKHTHTHTETHTLRKVRLFFFFPFLMHPRHYFTAWATSSFYLNNCSFLFCVFNQRRWCLIDYIFYELLWSLWDWQEAIHWE